MNVKIKKGEVFGKLNAIPSISYAHRIAICNFLAGKTPTGGCKDFTSKDITATEDCLARVLNGEKVLDCGESGSTLRFLLPVLGAIGGEYQLVGHGKLMDRPNDELFAVLSAHNVAVEKTDSIKISGKLESGEFTIRGDISSQYISGLIMALPILNGDSKIILSTPLVSSAYVDITLEVLSLYGIKIQKTEYGYLVFGNQKYSGEATPEGDWSNVAFFMTLGALAGEVTLGGLNLSSVQGDRKIVEILRLAGASVDTSPVVKVKNDKLKAFTFDAENCPDLVPIASALAGFCEGKTLIKNVERLKIKESDRIESIISLLASFGIKGEFDGKNLIIYGGQPTAGKVDSFNDHRIAMSGAVMATAVDGESVIFGAEAVNKSYPNFFEDLKKVGGAVEYE